MSRISLISRIAIMASCHGAVSTTGIYPTSNIQRYDIPKEKISWSINFPEYSPPFFESNSLKGKPWADPDIKDGVFQWNSVDKAIDRRSFEGTYTIDNNYPLNPVGRTGIRGRGLLGRWGPNHAADPIVTRWKRDDKGNIVENSDSNKPILQLVVIKRRDNGMWALPGGMVDLNEKVSSAAVREFLEEATNSLQKSDVENNAIKSILENFFKTGEEVYKGYVNDPRNTDNAWIETTAFNFHDNDGKIFNRVKLEAGDDAAGVRWIDINKDVILYASHSHFVQKVVEIKMCHW